MGGLKTRPDRSDLDDKRFEPPAVWHVGDGVDGPHLMFTPPPVLGPFKFPSPYGTEAVRLTNASNAAQGVEPRVYPYDCIVNNHRGRSTLNVFVGRIGQSPIILSVDKRTGAVDTLDVLPWQTTGEGCYWSDTDPDLLYFLDGPTLKTYSRGTVRDVFTLDPKLGDDLWQAHSSADDSTHSATVRRRTNEGPFDVLGAVVYKGGKQLFFSKRGAFDECIVDKSGRWLIIQEDNDNRIIDLNGSGVFPAHTIPNADGALSHIDVGDQFMVGENDQGSMWTMDKVDLASGAREVIYRGSGAWLNGMGHVAIRGNSALLSANDGPELLEIDLDRRGARQVAPGLIDGSDYDHQLRACWDAVGEWACWVSSPDGSRFDAFLVRVSTPMPQVIVPDPPDPKPKPPTPGVSMKPFPYFTSAASVELAHDRGFTAEGAPGTFDGRDALIIPTVDTLPEGEGAWVTLKWANGKGVRQHGRFYLKQEPDRATFAVDMTEEPTGF